MDRPNVLAGVRRAPRKTRRARLLGRLTSHRNLEAANIVLFWLLFTLAWSDAAHPSTWGFRTYALAIVTLILAEGAYYWRLKLRSLRTRRPLPARFRRTFACLRSLNLVLFAACPPIAGLFLALDVSSIFDLIMGSLLVAFAGLEHLNYFHVQLMHDNHNDWAYLRRNRRLRRAPLAEDLQRIR